MGHYYLYTHVDVGGVVSSMFFRDIEKGYWFFVPVDIIVFSLCVCFLPVYFSVCRGASAGVLVFVVVGHIQENVNVSHRVFFLSTFLVCCACVAILSISDVTLSYTPFGGRQTLDPNRGGLVSHTQERGEKSTQQDDFFLLFPLVSPAAAVVALILLHVCGAERY